MCDVGDLLYLLFSTEIVEAPPYRDILYVNNQTFIFIFFHYILISLNCIFLHSLNVSVSYLQCQEYNSGVKISALHV